MSDESPYRDEIEDDRLYNKLVVNFVEKLDDGKLTPRVILTKYLPIMISDNQKKALREALIIHGNN